ncbi:MAG: hypothetical protein ACLU4J_12665 [Butyricimonas paravirosa]
MRFYGIALPWRRLGLRAKETVGNGDHVRLDSSFFFQQGKVTFTLKQNYAPWEVSLGGKWWLEPLVTGLYMNTVLSDDFWVKEPEKYPNNYYKFSTRVRFHIFTGQRIAFDLGPHSPFRRITAFYELSTCDLYIISSATNKYVRTWDILSLSFGVKLHIL